MKPCVTTVAFVLVCAASSHDVRAAPPRQRWTPRAPPDSGVRVDFFGDSGVQYVFTRAALTVRGELPDAGFVGDDFFVPARGERHGCFIKTPSIPVSVAAGNVEAYPHLRVEWMGEVGPPADPNQTLLNFLLTITHADGTTSQARSEIHAGTLRLERLRDDWYHGVLDTVAGKEQLLASTEVKEGDRVELQICDVFSLVELTLHDVALKVGP
jgi:hypothetical protein